MTEDQWLNLQIGDVIWGGYKNQPWIVSEICEEERFISKWGAKVKRIVNLRPLESELLNAHTWAGRHEQWNITDGK